MLRQTLGSAVVNSNVSSKKWTCLLSQMRNLLPVLANVRMEPMAEKIHTSSWFKKEDRREKITSAPTRDQGVEGEKYVKVDFSNAAVNPMFPNMKTPDLVFDGVRFGELPICHLKVSKNNTLMALTDFRGKILRTRTCGMEGFKNAKKGTNIAAQTTGLTLGKKAIEMGMKNVRVKVQGLGPGRMASVRGLQMSGLNIVSITDDTPMPGKTYPRPRKQRRL